MRLIVDGQVVAVEAGDAPRLVTGTAPDVLSLEVDAEVSKRLREGAEVRGSTIRLEAPEEGTSHYFSGWTILGDGPSSTRGTVVLTLADPRWVLPRRYLTRSYNVRVGTGTLRREVSDGPLVARVMSADEAYVAWSLRGAGDGLTAWTPEDVIRDVLDAITEKTGIPWEDRNGVLGSVNLPEVEELELGGSLDAVLGQVLGYMGGRLNVYVDVDGTLVLIDQHDLSELGLVGLGDPGGGTRTRDEDSAGPRELEREQLWALQDRSMERPEKVRVLFDMGVELRVDSQESVQGGSTGTSRKVLADQVLQSPEDGTIGGSQVLAGTWVDQLDYHTFLQGKSPASLPNFSRDLMRKNWLSGALETYSRLDPTGLWSRRVAAFRQHVRQTIQIREPWRSRIRTVEPKRVAVFDYETGARGASPVLLDYAEWLSWRAPDSKTVNDGPEAHERVRNRYAVQAGGGGIVDARIDVMLASGKQAPALLSVVDQDQKILRIDFAFDWQGEAVDYLPSALTKDSTPSAAPRSNVPWLADGELTESWELSTVVTCHMGSPNDNRRLYSVEVDPTDVDVPGIDLSDSLFRARGPEVEVHVDPQKALARFGWDDGKADQIRRVFSEDLNAQRDLAPQDLLPEPVNKDLLEAVARAEATRVYLRYVDHVEGEITTGFRPGARPTGGAESVTHRAGPDGATTTVAFRTDPPQVDVSALLPPGVRRLVNRRVDL